MMRRRTLVVVGAAAVAAWSCTGPLSAQSASSCPPPLKLAAGACVRSCPGGFEDRGRDCVYRNLSR